MGNVSFPIPSHQHVLHVSIKKLSLFYTILALCNITSRSTGYTDELCSAALWLYRATGEQQYMDIAEQYYSNAVPWALSWDDKTVANQVHLYQKS